LTERAKECLDGSIRNIKKGKMSLVVLRRMENSPVTELVGLFFPPSPSKVSGLELEV
jgi:hypothetical protein